MINWGVRVQRWSYWRFFGCVWIVFGGLNNLGSFTEKSKLGVNIQLGKGVGKGWKVGGLIDAGSVWFSRHIGIYSIYHVEFSFWDFLRDTSFAALSKIIQTHPHNRRFFFFICFLFSHLPRQGAPLCWHHHSWVRPHELAWFCPSCQNLSSWRTTSFLAVEKY